MLSEDWLDNKLEMMIMQGWRFEAMCRWQLVFIEAQAPDGHGGFVYYSPSSTERVLTHLDGLLFEYYKRNGIVKTTLYSMIARLEAEATQMLIKGLRNGP